MANIPSMVGRRFTRWTVLFRVSSDRLGFAKWCCRCDCGEIRDVLAIHLRAGNTRSCGCLANEMLRNRCIKHAMYRSNEFHVWIAMRQRCENKRNPGYKDYGGRGIQVCERWQQFANFFADMGPRPAGLSIERRNNNAGYSPDNCYWADRFAQATNTRRNRFVTLAGRTQNVRRWSKELGVSSSALYAAVKIKKLEKYEKLAAAL